MIVLFISDKGEGYALANMFVEEGHRVKMYCKHTNTKEDSSESQNIQKVEQWQQHIRDADLVVFGRSGLGGIAERVEKRGRPIFGCSKFGDAMKYDREFAYKCTQALGLDFDLREDKDAVVVGGWFNGERFVAPFCAKLYERFMEGGKGVLTDGMGIAMWLCAFESRIVSEILLKFEDLLKRVRHTGVFGVQVVCSSDTQACVVGFMSGNETGVLYATSELYRGSVVSFIQAIIDKTDIHAKDFRRDYSIAVKLSVPPYPYGFLFDDTGFDVNVSDIVNVPDPARRHVWLETGREGVLGWVSARGETFRECRRRVSRTIENCVQLLDVQYRYDISVGLDELQDRLFAWGWLTSPSVRDKKEVGYGENQQTNS